MNKITPQEKITALSKAKKEIAQLTKMNPDTSWGICGRLYHTNRADQYLRNYISRQLGPRHAFLTDWLAKHRPHLPRNPRDMCRYRLQWIDWMINCLKEDIKNDHNKTSKTHLQAGKGTRSR